MSVQSAIVVGLIIYGCLMLGVSLFFMLRVKSASDYLLAGRGLPYWVLSGTIVGTCIGTGVVIGATGLAYKHGWAGCVYPLGLGIGTVLAGWWFAQMRRHDFMTLSEEIACYYGGNRVVVEFSNVGLFLSQLCWLTVQIMGGAAVLGVVTGLPREFSLLLSGAITAVISIPDGLKTVVYTDCLQAFILIGGFAVLAQMILGQPGGLAGLTAAVPPAYTSFLGVESIGAWKIVSLGVALVLGIIADPGRRLSMYSAISEGAAKWSMITAGLIVIVFSVVVGLVGMFAYKLNPNLAAADQALPWLVMNVPPPWMASLVVVSVASAIFSSANGNAAAAGTFFVRHIFPLMMGRFPKKPLVVVRVALIGVFIFATAFGLFTGSIVSFVARFVPVTMSGLAVIIMLGRFWKRATWQGAFAALITSPVVSLAVMFVPSLTAIWGEPGIPAAIAGLLAHVVVSLVTPPPRHSFDEIVQAMRRERQSIEGAVSH
ncbi:MAG: sodium:solute symporter family protein [Opitutus sp.]|nr:sodium:solute symporter family protein [Opitutus sp.]